MECIKSCKITSETERLVACHLCENIFHLKCVKLAAKIVDSMSADSGLFWLCSGCRKINATMYNLYKQNHKAFREISHDLAAIQNKLANYEQLFSKNLAIEQSSKASKPSQKIKEKSAKRKVSFESVVSPTTIQKPNPSPTLVTAPIINLSVPAINEPFITFSPTSTADSNPANIQPNTLVSASRASNSSSTAVTTSHTLPASNSVNNNSLISIPDEILNPFEKPSSSKGSKNLNKVSEKPTSGLRVVIPRKTLFISRVADDTTEKDILDYIKLHIPPPSFTDISVKKFKFSYKRLSSSFNISVPTEVFPTLVDSSFWPKGLIVHEFVYNSKNKSAKVPVSIPKTSDLQKN